MPRRLRPTSEVAEEAILVGDPGRALLLAQELLEKPRMSNHARGLWGYSGRTPAGDELTVQSTGMGGPSAAAVMADLAKLGVRRAVRVGTCSGLSAATRRGELLLPEAAVAEGGSATAFGLEVGSEVEPDPGLLGGLRRSLAEQARGARVASFDAMPPEGASADGDGDSRRARGEVEAADMQTVAVLASGRRLGVAAAAVLIVDEAAGEAGRLSDEEVAEAAKRAGKAASEALSQPKV